MILALIALTLLFSGVVLKRLNLSTRVRAQVAGIMVAVSLLAILLVSWRLAPLAGIVWLIGLGAAANLVVRDRAQGSADGLFGGARQETPPQRPPSASMSREEALAILGLEGSPSEDTITAAHKRMIVRAHPDQGGSDYLAAKVNAARRTLLGS
ncbi:MAG: hypothetical protein AAGH41_14380 [Pseudomonadota bacterium]